MLDLIINRTENTPYFKLDTRNRLICMIGRAVHYDIEEFYGSILNQLEEFFCKVEIDLKRPILFNIYIEYATRSNWKFIGAIFIKLQEIFIKGQPVYVNLFFESDDEDAFEVGEYLGSIFKMPFFFIETDDKHCDLIHHNKISAEDEFEKLRNMALSFLEANEKWISDHCIYRMIGVKLNSVNQNFNKFWSELDLNEPTIKRLSRTFEYDEEDISVLNEIAIRFAKEKNFKKSFNLAQAISVIDRNTDVWIKIGNEFYPKNSEIALECYLKSIDNMISDGELFYKVAQCYSKLSDYENAVFFLQKNLELDNKCLAALEELLYIYSITSNYLKASEVSTKLIELKNNM